MIDGRYKEEYGRLVGEPLRQARENVLKEREEKGLSMHPANVSRAVLVEYYRIVGHTPWQWEVPHVDGTSTEDG